MSDDLKLYAYRVFVALKLMREAVSEGDKNSLFQGFFEVSVPSEEPTQILRAYLDSARRALLLKAGAAESYPGKLES